MWLALICRVNGEGGPPPGEAQRGPDGVGVRRNHNLPMGSAGACSPLLQYSQAMHRHELLLS